MHTRGLIAASAFAALLLGPSIHGCSDGGGGSRFVASSTGAASTSASNPAFAVIATSPQDGDQAVAVDATLYVTFSEDVDPASIAAPGAIVLADDQGQVAATIQAITNPSADIAHGFDGTMLTLKDGTIVQGILDSGSDPLVIRSMGGISQMIPADRVQNRARMGRSLMLTAEQLGFSAQDVADIVAYLRAL